MKYVYTVLTFFVLTICVSAQNFDWEWQNPSLQSNNLNDVVSLSATSLIAVGDAGSLVSSNDGGLTWSYKQINFEANDLTSLYFLNSTTGFVCGDNGLILKTIDAGATWTALTSGTSEKLWDIEFIDADSGYAVGDKGTVLKTVNGGTSWSLVTTPVTNAIYSIAIRSASNILLGTSSSSAVQIISRSTDYGVTWTNVAPAAFASSVYSFNFGDAETGYAFCSSAKVLKTTDNGATFTEIKDFGDGSAYSGYFSSATTGYVPVGNNVNITTDGGTSWTTTLVSEELLRDILLSSAGLVTVGNAGLIYTSSDNGVNWASKVNTVTTKILRKIIALDENTLISGSGSNAAADSVGFLIKTTDGGAHWVKMDYDFKHQVTAIAAPTATTWYVGTADNRILKSTDAGINWTKQTQPITGTTNDFYDIKFADENNGYAVGQNGKFIKTTDGGATWTNVTNPFGTGFIYNTALFDNQTLIAIGAGPNIHKTTDGGTTWTSLVAATGVPGIPFSIDFIGDFGVVACFNSAVNYISVTRDGGDTWTPVNSPSNTTVSSWALALKDTSTFWLADGGGHVTYTTDGGNTWVNAKSFSGNPIYDFAQANGKLWMVGNNGTILKGYSDYTVPVELTAFTANIKNNKVVIAWQTATETNNRGFDVERKAPGSSWKNIAFVPGKGTTSETSSYVYEDAANASGKVYYRLKQVDYDGSFEYTNAVEVDVVSPVKFELSQNYPNPFNPSTTIKYSVPQKENVTLKIFNVLGKEIAVLVNGVQESGSYSVKFDASAYSSGVYFYELTSGANRISRKMILIK